MLAWILGAISSWLIVGMFLTGEITMDGPFTGYAVDPDIDIIRRINGEVRGLIDTTHYTAYVTPRYSGYSIRARDNTLLGRFREPDWTLVLKPLRIRLKEMVIEAHQAEQAAPERPLPAAQFR